MVVPEANAREAALVPGANVRVAQTLGELHMCLAELWPWPELPDPPPMDAGATADDEPMDLADVRGLPHAQHALSVAAAGGHHLLMVGPPGVGKTMLARRLPTILVPLEPDEALEVTKVHSAAGLTLPIISPRARGEGARKAFEDAIRACAP